MKKLLIIGICVLLTLSYSSLVFASHDNKGNITQDGDYNVGDIYENGWHNKAKIYQKYDYNKAYVELEYRTNYNIVNQTQVGTYNWMKTLIEGQWSANNFVRQEQMINYCYDGVNHNNGYVEIEGDNNTATQHQEGNNNSSNIDITGNGNKAHVFQD